MTGKRNLGFFPPGGHFRRKDSLFIREIIAEAQVKQYSQLQQTLTALPKHTNLSWDVIPNSSRTPGGGLAQGILVLCTM